MSADKPSIREVLQDACDRNIGVQIHLRDHYGELMVLHSRLISFDDNRVYLLRPSMNMGQAERLERVLFEVYFQLNDSPYSFTSTLSAMHCSVALNERKTTDGMAITLPSELVHMQRRTDFRVLLAGAERVRVVGHDAGPTPSVETVGLDPFRFAGEIVDLSPSGISIVINEEEVPLTPMKSRVFLEFTPPGQERSCHMLAEVRHARPVRDGTATRLGLKFLPYPSVRAYRRLQDRLYRWLTRLQRKQLRNVA